MGASWGRADGNSERHFVPPKGHFTVDLTAGTYRLIVESAERNTCPGDSGLANRLLWRTSTPITLFGHEREIVSIRGKSVSKFAEGRQREITRSARNQFDYYFALRVGMKMFSTLMK
jgi:hypothetical protein